MQETPSSGQNPLSAAFPGSLEDMYLTQVTGRSEQPEEQLSAPVEEQIPLKETQLGCTFGHVGRLKLEH